MKSKLKEVAIFLCDKTGNMALPWAQAGVDCYCIDIQHSIRKSKTESVGKGSITYQWGDCRSWLPPANSKIIFMASFPPCTDLTVAGARDFEMKAGYRLSDAIELFDACQLASAYSQAPYLIENPVGRLSSHKRKPDFTFDPCDYGGYLKGGGDRYTKKTCLWTGGGFVMPQKKWLKPTEGSKMHKMPPSDDRADLRSATPMGFANAVFIANHH